MKENRIYGLLKIISIIALCFGISVMSLLSRRLAIDIGDDTRYSNMTGMIFYLKRDIHDYMNINKLKSINSDADLEEKLSRFKVRKYGLNPVGKKNMLLIQLESMDGYVMDHEYGGEYLMPFLRELSKRGVWYENAYDQTGIGHTSDFEFMVSTFNLPVRDLYAYVNYSFRDEVTFQKLIKDYGYQSIYVHGGDRTFYSRESKLEDMGYDEFVFGDDMSDVEELGWGASDEYLLDYVLELMKKYRGEDPKKRHYINLATLSNHLPYNYAPKRVIEKPRHVAEDYINSVRYTDDAIRGFVESLEREGLLNDWILVFASDHDSLVTKMQYEYWGEEEPEEDRLVLLILDGENTGVKQEIVGQGDIPFMLAEIAGFDFPREGTIGGKLYLDPKTGICGLPTPNSNILNIENGQVGYVLEDGMDFDINEITKYKMGKHGRD